MSFSPQLIRHATRIVDGNVNMTIPWILMSALAYEQASPIVPDSLYDEWCQRAARCWGRIDHGHKTFVLFDGGGKQVSVILKEDQYPGITKGTLHMLRIKYGVTIDEQPSKPSKRELRAARRARRRRTSV